MSPRNLGSINHCDVYVQAVHGQAEQGVHPRGAFPPRPAGADGPTQALQEPMGQGIQHRLPPGKCSLLHSNPYLWVCRGIVNIII